MSDDTPDRPAPSPFEKSAPKTSGPGAEEPVVGGAQGAARAPANEAAERAETGDREPAATGAQAAAPSPWPDAAPRPAAGSEGQGGNVQDGPRNVRFDPKAGVAPAPAPARSDVSGRNVPFEPPNVYSGQNAENQPADSVQSDALNVRFEGRRGALFWLALKTGFLTVLTLGFYRFWMKTRLRRWFWSAIQPGGHPLEYVGDPLEKLLGFFIAVVILTFYIGILNLGLMFISFSVFSASWLGYGASVAGLVPLWFYARYRARRYVLGRTRWRGVRFGLEPGAWGYALRAMLHWAVTLLSLGILWPRMTFALEKYRTDRTFFGSARLVQGGRWPMLYRAAVPLIAGLLSLLAYGLWVTTITPVFPGGLAALDEAPDRIITALRVGQVPQMWDRPERLFALPLFVLWLLYGAIHYRWAAKRIMANHKHADGIRFASRLSSARVAMIYVLGTLLSYMVLVAGIALIAFVAVVALSADVLPEGLLDAPEVLQDLPRWASMVLMALLYLATFLLWSVLHTTFVTYPILRHAARSTTLPDTQGLARISQRERDAFAEAEGFAEALDLGAAI